MSILSLFPKTLRLKSMLSQDISQVIYSPSKRITNFSFYDRIYTQTKAIYTSAALSQKKIYRVVCVILFLQHPIGIPSNRINLWKILGGQYRHTHKKYDN